MATFILVPGGGGDAWDWHRLVPELERLGHRAIAVTLPAADDAAGWAEYADVIAAAGGTPNDRVVVAHSLGGFSASLACDRMRVELLVLLNAMVPRPGETGAQWGADVGSAEAQREYLREIGLSAADAEDDEILYYHDVPAQVVQEARRRQPHQSWTPMTQPWPLTAWPDVPTRVLAGRDDRLFPARFQRRVARERLGIEADEMDGGHMLALSRPAQLAARLEDYRREAARRPA